MSVDIFAVSGGSQFLLASLVPQTPGSLTTQLNGRILAASSNGNRFDGLGGSYLDPFSKLVHFCRATFRATLQASSPISSGRTSMVW